MDLPLSLAIPEVVVDDRASGGFDGALAVGGLGSPLTAVALLAVDDEVRVRFGLVGFMKGSRVGQKCKDFAEEQKT